MFRKLFLDHPAEVGENYAQHFSTASRIGIAMIGGGVAALIHAFVPALFKTKGGDTIKALNARVIANRTADRDARTIEWMI